MSIPADMRTAAVAMHEVFISFMAAGFTRAEALELVKTQMVAQIQNHNAKKEES